MGHRGATSDPLVSYVRQQDNGIGRADDRAKYKSTLMNTYSECTTSYGLETYGGEVWRWRGRERGLGGETGSYRGGNDRTRDEERLRGIERVYMYVCMYVCM